MDRNKILSISFDMDLKLICIKYSINNQIYESRVYAIIKIDNKEGLL